MYSILSEINQTILEAEKNNKPGMIKDLLSKSFTFLRANKEIVNKKTYLEQMKLISYSRLEQHSMEVIPMTPESACVIVEIGAKGKRPDDTEFEGVFRNVRFFRKLKERWELYAWRNDGLKDGQLPALTEKEKFSGMVIIHKLEEKDLPEGGRWQQVLFHTGSRTRWHIHPEGQGLFILSGTALVVIRKDNDDEDIIHVNAGGQAHIPPGVLHWHGATKNSFMVHIAYNPFSFSSETSYWFDPVTDEQYARANEKLIAS